MTPSKKFQPVWRPIGSQSCLLLTNPYPRKSPARNIPATAIQLALGFEIWSMPNTTEERNHPHPVLVPLATV